MLTGVYLTRSTPPRDQVHPPGSRHPPEQTPPWEHTPPRSRHTPTPEQTPPGADTPQEHTPLQQTPPGADTPPPEQTPSRSRHPPQAQSMLGDTVNARAIRILLECNLVKFKVLHTKVSLELPTDDDALFVYGQLQAIKHSDGFVATVGQTTC